MLFAWPEICQSPSNEYRLILGLGAQNHPRPAKEKLTPEDVSFAGS
jgi:hypothetical protein